MQIDNGFIGRWQQQYDAPWIAGDEREYETLVTAVARDMASTGTISKETFLEVWNWKGAMRSIRHTTIYVDGYVTKARTADDEYDTCYAMAFRRAAAEPPERKLAALLGHGKKLPGVGAATGSTIIHFIHPGIMPIIDVRTVEALVEADLISTKQRDLDHYEEYREAIDRIRDACPDWTLRQIDRALFAYHKQMLDKKSQHRKRLCQAELTL